MAKKTKLDCGHAPSAHSEHTTGYGTDSATGETRCYDCCAKTEREAMIETGRATLYLTGGPRRSFGMEPTGEPYAITDWPGKLRFKPRHVRQGRHNMAGNRYDAWFAGPDGFVWHGIQYGDNTQIIHCRRTREKTATS